MPSGGARAVSGPPPDPNAIRRDRKTDQATWVTLTVRTGDVPPWPLTESTKREDAMWSRLWTTPQASQWEANAWHDEVALYVRTFCEAAEKDASPAVRTLVLRQMEGLGLSAAGLNRLRWRLPNADTAKEAPKRDRRSSIDKARFTVIPGEAREAS